MQQDQKKNLIIPLQLAKVIYNKWNAELMLLDKPDQIYGKALHGSGQVEFKNKNKYIGNFYNGMLHGQGKFIWTHSTIYEGTFTYNQITGKGKYTFPDQSIYQGQVKKGLKHGYGVYKTKNSKEIYSGQWKDGVKQGQGKIQFSSGAIFEGKFQNGHKQGFGKMVYESRNYYEGQWKNDMKEGYGIMNWISLNQKYQGQWVANKQQNFGSYIWLEPKAQNRIFRNRYEGMWKAGQRQGMGVFYYYNSLRYWGEWKNNLKQGYAILLDQNGNHRQTMFHNDRQDKQKKLKKITKTQIQNQKRQIQRNPYSLMVNVEDLTAQQQMTSNPFSKMPMQQYLSNYLLRNNSLLRKYYKFFTNRYQSNIQNHFCLTLQGFWRMCKQVQILGLNVTLASIDRLFFRSSKSIYQMNIDTQTLQNKINISKIIKFKTKDLQYLEYLGIAHDVLNNTNCFSAKVPKKNIHDGNSIILFRHFVQLLVRIAYLKYGNINELHKSVQKLLKKIEEPIQAVLNVQNNSNSNFNDISSVNSFVLKRQIQPYAQEYNQKLFHSMTQHIKRLPNKQDRTLRIKDVIKVLERSKIILQTHQKMHFYYRLEKHMDPDLTMYGLQFGGEKIKEKSKKKAMIIEITSEQKKQRLANLLEFQIIFYQFNQIIYQYLTRKVVKAISQQQLKRRYIQVIQTMIASIQKPPSLKTRRIVPQTSKDKAKSKLIWQRKIYLQEQQRKKIKRQQMQRQQAQNAWMGLQDIDIVSQVQQNQSSLYSDY